MKCNPVILATSLDNYFWTPILLKSVVNFNNQSQDYGLRDSKVADVIVERIATGIVKSLGLFFENINGSEGA